MPVFYDNILYLRINMKGKIAFRRILFYLLSFTWGAIMSTIGLIAMGIFACCGRVRVWHGRLYALVGNDWGGLELGCFFLAGKNGESNPHLCGHECGHGLQNCLWGPLFIFVIFLPSAIRYWYRYLRYERKGKTPPTKYDDIWFEGQATKWGTKYVNTDML